MRAKLFWNLFAKRYSKSPISDMKGYEHTLAMTRTYLDAKKNVLEIGCGTGTTALKLADTKCRYLATDISPKMIAIGKEKCKDETQIQLQAVTVFDPTLKEGTYDVVIGFNIVHLLSNRDKVMQRINALLKPNGVFISKTPCLGGNRAMKVFAFFMRAIIGPIRCFTMCQLKDSMEKSRTKSRKRTCIFRRTSKNFLSRSKRVRS